MAEKKKTGRPRKLNEEMKEQILRVIEIGGSRQKAAMLVGVSRQVLGEEAKRDPVFFTRLKEAEGKAYNKYLTVIGDAAESGDVKAAQWMLARKYPEEFSEMRRNALTNARGKDLTQEERHKLMDAIIAERKAMEEG